MLGHTLPFSAYYSPFVISTINVRIYQANVVWSCILILRLLKIVCEQVLGWRLHCVTSHHHAVFHVNCFSHTNTQTKVWCHHVSSPQLSPYCSPTMDWWTSSRPSSPRLPPLLHPPVLLLPCSAIAIYSCPPWSPCNTFTLHRYPLMLSSAFITKTKRYMIWRTGIHLFYLLVSDTVLQNYSLWTTHSPHMFLWSINCE